MKFSILLRDVTTYGASSLKKAPDYLLLQSQPRTEAIRHEISTAHELARTAAEAGALAVHVAQLGRGGAGQPAGC